MTKATLGMIDFELLERTVDEITSTEELKTKLDEGRPLRIKYGVDVTAPFLHLGHAVNLWVMRHFQEKGHKVIFLIGDFTTRIGDPTGKSNTRKQISISEIEKNSQDFIEQVKSILIDDQTVFEIRRNSEWFEKMPTSDFLSLLSMITHSKLISRDMFQARIAKNQEIYIHEMLYPILQGYDSYMLESDLTVVGSDQLFNELLGRFYQERFGQKPQVVMTTKITPGIDGKEKQSKSLGNYIAIADSPRNKYGKAMSIPDNLIEQYLQVYTDVPIEEIKKLAMAIRSEQENPMTAKRVLAKAIVNKYHGHDIGEQEEEWFSSAFSKRKAPEDLQEVLISKNANIIKIVHECVTDQSKSNIRRLIGQGGISINNQRITSIDAMPDVNTGDIIKVGKTKWFRLRIHQQ